jgi:hypothetical protein
MGSELWIPSRRAWAWDSHLEVVYQAVQELGPGRAQVAGVAVGTGLGAGLPVGASEIRAATRLGSGVNVAIGLDQRELPLRVFPRLVWSTEAGLHTEAGFVFSARLEVNALRIRYGRVGQDRLVPEPLVRGGLVVGLGGPLRRQ